MDFIVQLKLSRSGCCAAAWSTRAIGQQRAVSIPSIDREVQRRKQIRTEAAAFYETHQVGCIVAKQADRRRSGADVTMKVKPAAADEHTTAQTEIRNTKSIGAVETRTSNITSCASAAELSHKLVHGESDSIRAERGERRLKSDWKATRCIIEYFESCTF